MADNWINILGKINKAAGVQPGDPVPVDHVLQAFNQAGMDEAEQARVLAGFLATHDTGTPGAEPAAPPAAAPAPATTLTIAQIIQLVQDPSKHEELVNMWKALPADQKTKLTNQIKALQPAKVDPQYNAAVSNMRKLVPLKQGKAVPENMKTGIMADIPKARVNKDWAQNTAKRILDLHAKGYMVQELHTAWMNANTAGKRAKSIQEQASDIHAD